MKIHRVLILVGAAASCTSVPTPTRVGQEILIAQHVVPDRATVTVFDEVRWVNRRAGSVKLVLLDADEGNVTCQRGFGFGLIAATLKPQHSASVCFTQPGTFRYTVRLDRALADGQMNVLGVIHVANRPRDESDGKGRGRLGPASPQ